MSLFVDLSTVENTKRDLTSFTADFFVDVSGSTSGSIIAAERDSATMLASILKVGKIVGWHTNASVVRSFAELRSTGGTNPTCFVPYLSTSSNLVVVYTDGQIEVNEMKKFKDSITGKLKSCPVLIIFAVPKFDMTLKSLQERYINMSIPESFLSLSNDVAILITEGSRSSHKVLMAKGCFDCLETCELSDDTLMTYLPNFNFNSLRNISVLEGLPSHIIKLKTCQEYIDLNVLYLQDDLSPEILEGLCDRTLLPKFNLASMHTMITRINRKLTENPELDAVRKELFEISTSGDAGTDKHREVIAKYNEIKTKKNVGVNKIKLSMINKLLEHLSEYQRNNTNITFGSNRAMRSTVFSASELEILGNCEQVECPILLGEGDGCVLLKFPENKNYIEEYTGDYAMEAPFEFGTWLTKLITPGLYCQEIAETLKENPMTRDKILGYLPLSDNPGVIMKHMSKLFGGNRELWHFVRGYISMMVHACDNNWVEKDKIIPSIKRLFANYNATLDLKGGNDKVPLKRAFEYVLTNYSTCMRDRTRGDNFAIMKIAKTILPEFVFDEQKITGMVNVVGVFVDLLAKYKQGENMLNYVMDVDDYGHYVTYKRGLYGLVAQLLWYDTNGEYRLLKLQIAIDKSMNDKRFGKEIRKAMKGDQFDESILECAFEEPHDNDHFGEPKHLVWTNTGLPELQCVYCGKHFDNTKEKLDHLRQKFGNHFYNGHLACKHAVMELGPLKSEKELFKRAKENLFRAYGDKNKALHTQRCKEKLLFFINKFTTPN